MAKLPAKYQWLEKEQHPKILLEALKLFGTLETPGDKNNPVILGWAKTLGANIEKVYKADSIPWCGLFMAYVVFKTGNKPVNNALWALSWAAWGVPVDTAMLGDVLVFTRDKGGHVGIYVGEDDTHYHVLGGNQSDAVCITRIAKNRLYAIRRTKWQVAQPANVRVIKLSSSGTPTTTNEK